MSADRDSLLKYDEEFMQSPKSDHLISGLWRQQGHCGTIRMPKLNDFSLSVLVIFQGQNMDLS